MKIFNKRIIVLLLLISFSISPIFVSKAEAQWVVFDPANFGVNTVTGPVKEFGLDTIAWTIANIVIERIAASTVTWINNGFRGNPSFVANPEQYFKNLADNIAGEVIYNHPDLNFMCSPFRAQVQIALTRTYAQRTQRFQCTLGQVANNWDNFMNDFTQGGWEGFINISQNSQNSPLGLYLGVQNELAQKINESVNSKTEELNRGGGFLTFKRCTTTSGEAYSDQGYVPGQGFVSGSYSSTAVDCETVTPGSVIENQLNNALGSGSNRLEAADEINEIISAILNQLVSKALGGLGGLARPGSGNNGRSFTTDLNPPGTDAQIQTLEGTSGNLVQQSENVLENSEAQALRIQGQSQEFIENGIPIDTSGYGSGTTSTGATNNDGTPDTDGDPTTTP